MKINYKVYKALNDEPFLTQDIDGVKIEFHYMNETPFLQQFVTKGRFYVWTSDGNDFKLLVERGFYDKVSYFFAEEINAVWVNFLTEASQENSKTSKVYLFGSLILSFVVVLVFYFFLKEQITTGIILALVIALAGNMLHSSKVNKSIREKNTIARDKIQELLTPAKFDQFIQDQNNYMKEYFAFDEDEDFEDDEEILTLEASEIIEDEDILVADLEENLVAGGVNYDEMTVAELKELAKERNLVGYSTLTKAKLIEFLKDNE